MAPVPVLRTVPETETPSLSTSEAGPLTVPVIWMLLEPVDSTVACAAICTPSLSLPASLPLVPVRLMAPLTELTLPAMKRMPRRKPPDPPPTPVPPVPVMLNAPLTVEMVVPLALLPSMRTPWLELVPVPPSPTMLMVPAPVVDTVESLWM
jgi:hypothetical protein